MYNFDEIIDRRNTNSIKYDFAVARGFPEDLTPLWVADMDFRIPPAVSESIIKSATHGIFGYSDSRDSYFDALNQWFSSRHNFKMQPEWLVKTPGVVFALAMAIRAFTKQGDSILIQTPVYYPFSRVILDNERKLVTSPLVYKNNQYTIDFHDFEEKIAQNKVKLFILCSPHNPIGRVWSKDELSKLSEICRRHHCVVVSDEIHCDFAHEGNNHHVFAGQSEEQLNNTVVCTSPSKTFNIAGLQVSNIFIANQEMRARFQEEITKSGYSQLNAVGLLACESAYRYGGDWLDQLKCYLTGNFEFLDSYLKENIPQLKLIKPEGTYLAWIDCNELGLSERELNKMIVSKAKLWLDHGSMFGKEGAGFQRINVACPRQTLRQAMTQLKNAVSETI